MELDKPLEYYLKKYFNYSAFHIGQKEIISDVLQGNDVLGILPTGAGKSLCYQLPARLIQGTTLVISPLISLMIDQVKQLKALHFKDVVALHSFIDPVTKRRIINHLSSYKIIYISPELLQQKHMLNVLKKLTIRLFVIDEAHCISQWGYEFRPDYLRLGEILNEFKQPTVLALSGTATDAIQNDIISVLKRPNMVKHIYPMDRENIALVIEQVNNDVEKQIRLVELLEIYHVPTLVYFSSRKTCEKVAISLAQKLTSQRITYYHGGMEAQDRIMVQQQFMNSQLDIICCTSAFGMGINKKDIRLIIHYHFPPQLESYIQEIGRAGRDGNESVSLLLYSKTDEFIPQNIIENELPEHEDIHQVFHQLFKLYKAKKAIPTTVEEIEKIFFVNETQWRFLLYQFEKHGMIKDNNIVYHKKTWQEALIKIMEFRNKRITLKHNQLKEIINWINSEACLRKKLYRRYQKTVTPPKYQCCSNCGFDYTKQLPHTFLQKNNEQHSWQQKLKSILLIGDEYETE